VDEGLASAWAPASVICPRQPLAKPSGGWARSWARSVGGGVLLGGGPPLSEDPVCLRPPGPRPAGRLRELHLHPPSRLVPCVCVCVTSDLGEAAAEAGGPAAGGAAGRAARALLTQDAAAALGVGAPRQVGAALHEASEQGTLVLRGTERLAGRRRVGRQTAA